MFPKSRLLLRRWRCGLAGLLLAACQAAPTPLPTATVLPLATATPFISTGLPLTATTPPTGTAAPTSSPTLAPTATPSASASATSSPTSAPPATATASVTARPTVRPTGLPTRVPVTITPLGPPDTDSVYSTTGGPAGYASTIQCQRGGATCTPVMSPGDVNFHLTVAGDTTAPWTHFVYLGLAVEKDGANVADAFMFVGAGWLQPAEVVGYDAGRTFSQPGTYVMRVSGCLTTDLKSNACTWATMAGDVVTFRIQ